MRKVFGQIVRDTGTVVAASLVANATFSLTKRLGMGSTLFTPEHPVRKEASRCIEDSKSGTRTISYCEESKINYPKI